MSTAPNAPAESPAIARSDCRVPNVRRDSAQGTTSRTRYVSHRPAHSSSLRLPATRPATGITATNGLTRWDEINWSAT